MSDKPRLIFAADHAGYEMKDHLFAWAKGRGYHVHDVGTFSEDRVDYPDFAHKGAGEIIKGHADLGIFVCGSGAGMAISANKTKGIRAADCWTPEIAKLTREHNNANVLCLPARFVSNAEAEAMAEAFLTAEFAGGRHAMRVDKIEEC